MSKLQIALDLTNLDYALQIAKEIINEVREENIIIEAGTPLIKSHGVKAITLLKEISKGVSVFADTKTIDAGCVEAEIAFRAGAKYVSALSFAASETIKDMIEVANIYGGKIVVDLINNSDPYLAITELQELGVEAFCLHIGVDVQRRRGITMEDLIDEISKLRENFPQTILAAAGGITPKTAETLSRIGVDIIVVGGYITRARNPLKATKQVLAAIS
ncbi:MAG: orotidine 5'-phosphate decarboxylase [Candidatus Diapherotrites archaeon]|nr:orotidine 5'-phosphate decarboxylase [Candidatus Diapherotrites archaeon]